MNLKRFLLLTIIISSSNYLTAQINLQSDSIKTILCQKWGFKAIIMGGQRLTNMNESVTYEFIADGTFKRISSSGKHEKGNWTHITDQKIILLKIKKTVLHITSLSSDELIISPDDGADASKNVLGMGTVLKPLESN